MLFLIVLDSMMMIVPRSRKQLHGGEGRRWEEEALGQRKRKFGVELHAATGHFGPFSAPPKPGHPNIQPQLDWSGSSHARGKAV